MVYRPDQRRVRLLRNCRSAGGDISPGRRLRTPASSKPNVSQRDQRRHTRMSAKGRKLQLLIDGSPTNFALHNISEGGVMGDSVTDLTPGARSTSASKAAFSFPLW